MKIDQSLQKSYLSSANWALISFEGIDGPKD